MTTATPYERLSGRPAATPAAKPVLGLEHRANVGPLIHVALYFGFFAFALAAPWTTRPLLAVPLMVLLSLLNYSLTIGVLHMHTHRPLFTKARPNRVVDLLCCVPSWLSGAEMKVVHVLNHHKYNDGPGDITSTMNREHGFTAIWYWLRYGVVVKRFTLRRVFAADAPRSVRRLRGAFVLDCTLVLAAIVTLTFLLPMRMLLFFWIPFVVIQVTSGYFAWLTHAPARDYEDASSSINTVGNILNFFIFNQGYHSVHHRYPGIHWTEIPDRLTYMREVEPAVIVPYWMTLNSAWRIVDTAKFRDEEYGARWQAKLERRVAGDGTRAKLLPWFAWI